MKRKGVLAFSLLGSLCVGGGLAFPATSSVNAISAFCAPKIIAAPQTGTRFAQAVEIGLFCPSVAKTVAGNTTTSAGALASIGSSAAGVIASSAQTERTNASATATESVASVNATTPTVPVKTSQAAHSPLTGTHGYSFSFLHPSPEVADVDIKIVAVLVAVLALLVTWRVHAQRVFFDMIDELYSLPHALEGVLIKVWYLAHLWCIGAEEYNITKSRFKSRSRRHRDVSRVACQGEALRNSDFPGFRTTLYQRTVAAAGVHRGRKDFLDQILSFFHDRLFLNPRLYAFLQADPIGNSLHLERRTREFIKQKMAHIEEEIEKTIAVHSIAA